MNTRTMTRAVAIGAFLLAGTPFASAQSKIAIVKFQEALLGTAEITVREMIRDGRLRAYSLGPRIVRLKRAEIESAFQPYGAA